MLLLFAPDHANGAVPRPCRAAGALGPQFLPQPGLELHGMQRAERRKAGRRFSPPPLPRAPPDRRRARSPPPRPRRPRLRQAPPSPGFRQGTAVRGLFPPARVIPNPRVFGGVRDLLVAFLRAMSPGNQQSQFLFSSRAQKNALSRGGGARQHPERSRE